MCARYSLEEWMIDALAERAEEIDKEIEEEKKKEKREMRPSNQAPVLAAKGHKTHLTQKTWGYPAPSGSGLLINARSETLADKPTFRNGFFNKRIIIPAAAYYEWNAKKEKFTIKRPDSAMIFFAGICDTFEGHDRFVIITTAPNASVEGIHDRMPLILEEDQIHDWLFEDDKSHDLIKHRPIDLVTFQEVEQLSMF